MPGSNAILPITIDMMYVCMSVCLSVCLSVYLAVCLSVYLSIYLSVAQPHPMSLKYLDDMDGVERHGWG